MKPHVLAAIGLLSAGCSHSPPQAQPAPGTPPPSPALPAPHLPEGAVGYAEQKLDLTIVGGAEAMVAGKTEPLTARVMAPPGSQVIGLQATQGKDAFTYALKLAVNVPTAGGAAKPLEVQIPFSPSANGTYYLDGARRYAIQVSEAGDYGYVGPSSYGSGSGRTASFLDAMGYTGGAYVPGGSGSTTQPSNTAPPAPPLFGDVAALPTLTPGPVLGNDQVTERDLLDLQGPNYGRRGERMRFTANFWTAGTGPIRADVVQNGFEVQVAALMAPAEREPVGGPMPRLRSLQFGWTFQDPGLYRITSQNGTTLATVQIY